MTNSRTDPRRTLRFSNVSYILSSPISHFEIQWQILNCKKNWSYIKILFKREIYIKSDYHYKFSN